MNTRIIDDRENNVINVFEELKIGEAFIDTDGSFCIKSDYDKSIYMFKDGETWDTCYREEQDMVIPLKIEIKIIGKM